MWTQTLNLEFKNITCKSHWTKKKEEMLNNFSFRKKTLIFYNVIYHKGHIRLWSSFRMPLCRSTIISLPSFCIFSMFQSTQTPSPGASAFKTLSWFTQSDGFFFFLPQKKLFLHKRSYALNLALNVYTFAFTLFIDPLPILSWPFTPSSGVKKEHLKTTRWECIPWAGTQKTLENNVEIRTKSRA